MPDETAPAAAPASPDGSPDLNTVLDAVVDAAPAPEPKPNYLLSPELFAKQAQELGELRAYKKAQEEAARASTVSATPAGVEFDWSNPEASLARLMEGERNRMRDELRQEFEPQIAPLRNAGMAQELVTSSPLAATLLSDKNVMEQMTNISNNPDLIAKQYSDLASLRFKAALFDQASERASARIKAQAALKANRPENAGAASPAVPPVGGTPPPPVEVPTNMDEAWKKFSMHSAAVPGARSV